jgi:MarR family transcriptional regulator, lower aerobic nicotinate degradation pathway regulator
MYLSLLMTVTVEDNILGVSTEAALRRLTADPGFLLSRVGAAVRAGFKDVLASRGIRPLQYMLLLVLAANSAASQQQLCVAAGVDSGNMVELLDGLEALQYASRARDPRDRRRYLVSITPAGRSVLAELRQAVEEYNASFFTPLTEPEREQLASSLGKLFATTAEGQPRTPAGESLGP